MEIYNEIKQKDDKEKQKFVHRSLADVQRAKLDKLMKNPVKQNVLKLPGYSFNCSIILGKASFNS